MRGMSRELVVDDLVPDDERARDEDERDAEGDHVAPNEGAPRREGGNHGPVDRTETPLKSTGAGARSRVPCSAMEVGPILAALPPELPAAVGLDGSRAVVACGAEEIVRLDGPEAFDRLDRLGAGWWAGFARLRPRRAASSGSAATRPDRAGSGVPDLCFIRFAAYAEVDRRGGELPGLRPGPGAPARSRPRSTPRPTAACPTWVPGSGRGPRAWTGPSSRPASGPSSSTSRRATATR